MALWRSKSFTFPDSWDLVRDYEHLSKHNYCMRNPKVGELGCHQGGIHLFLIKSENPWTHKVWWRLSAVCDAHAKALRHTPNVYELDEEEITVYSIIEN